MMLMEIGSFLVSLMASQVIITDWSGSFIALNLQLENKQMVDKNLVFSFLMDMTATSLHHFFFIHFNTIFIF